MRRYYGCARTVSLLDRRQIKWWWQRLTRGFDDTELWNLDATVSEFILPRLRAYKDGTPGHPACVTSYEDWHLMLDDMIFAFESQLDPGKGRSNKDVERIRHGFKCFSEYFPALWW